MKKSKFLKIILILILLCWFIYFALCLSEKPKVYTDIRGPKTQLKDGTYIGKSFKFPGRVKVSVTIKNGEIVDIKILKLISPKKYTNMVKMLIDKIIKRQSTEVDTITGATMNSNALKKAVDNALSKAVAIHN